MTDSVCAFALSECLIYSASLSLWYYSVHHERFPPKHHAYYLTAISLAILGRLALMVKGCNGIASVLVQGVFTTELPLAVVGTCSQLLRWAHTTEIALSEDGSTRIRQVVRSIQASGFFYGSVSIACVLSKNEAGSLLPSAGSIGLALAWVGLLSTFAVAICLYGSGANSTSLGCLVLAMFCLGAACLFESLAHMAYSPRSQKDSQALVHGPGLVTLWTALATLSLSVGEVSIKLKKEKQQSGVDALGDSKLCAKVGELI